MSWLVRFARFWYDFIVGDDWTIAVAVIALVALTDALAREGHRAWPVLPLGVALVVSISVWRVLRFHQRASDLGDGGPD